MTDAEMNEAVAMYQLAAKRCLDAFGDIDLQDQLAILGLAATVLLRRLPAYQRVPEAQRWSECLVATLRRCVEQRFNA